MTYGYKKPHITFLDRPTKYTTPLQEDFRQKWLSRIGVGIFCCLVILGWMWLINSASAQDGLQSSRPQGFFGQGHAENHKYYLGLRNRNNGSCCNGKDCRPTQARWDYERSTWQVMVNGEWRVIDPIQTGIYITDEVLAMQGRERWDAQAHVCTSVNGNTIYCVILPASGG